jgi:DNA-binding beta-propeller fold protein YncE
MNRFRLLPLILCLALCAPIPATAGVLSNHKPIAAAKAHNGSLFLLTEDGIVLAVNLSQTAASIEGRFRLQQPGFASDMILGRYNSNDALFVVSTWSASATSVQGIIQAYTTDGHLLHAWTLAHSLAGVTYDPEKDIVYLSTADSHEIYNFSPQSSDAPRYLAEVAGARHLGALTIDPQRHQLYAADVEGGTIFAVDLAARRTTTIAQVGTPQALLIDPNGPQLLVADSSQKQILTFDLRNAKVPPPRHWNTGRVLRSPAGLAWYDPSRLIVADEQAGIIALIDPADGLMYTTRLMKRDQQQMKDH